MALPLDDPVNTADPPPPYPSRERRTRAARASRRHRDVGQPPSLHTQFPSTESDPDGVTGAAVAVFPFPITADATPDANGNVYQATESTPLLLSPSARRRTGRPRTLSYTSTLVSTVSAAPSLAHTIVSLFLTEPDSDLDTSSDTEIEGRQLLAVEDNDGVRRRRPPEFEQRSRSSFYSRRAWKRYFRPMTQRAYYAALFHLLVLNFPYALAAWVFLFVFTLVSPCPSALPRDFEFAASDRDHVADGTTSWRHSVLL
jgi:hypothetical protein